MRDRPCVTGSSMARIGHLNGAGDTEEKVYDVALAGGRTLGRNGQVAAVGNTVDVATASYSSSIGAAGLRSVWSDPDFDQQQRAFYCARVLEIPTPSWQAFDAKNFGDKFPDSVKMTIQDRAYTSPIWYTS